MATPALTFSTTPLPQIHFNTAQSLSFGIVRDAAGDPIDISTGWTAKLTFLYQTPAGNGSLDKTGTFSYGADGSLSLALTQTQAQQILPGFLNAIVTLSDDSYTTQSTHAGGNVQVTSP